MLELDGNLIGDVYDMLDVQGLLFILIVSSSQRSKKLSASLFNKWVFPSHKKKGIKLYNEGEGEFKHTKKNKKTKAVNQEEKKTSDIQSTSSCNPPC